MTGTCKMCGRGMDFKADVKPRMQLCVECTRHYDMMTMLNLINENVGVLIRTMQKNECGCKHEPETKE